jgi:hypothetical protein
LTVLFFLKLPLNQAQTMKMRNLLALAAFGGLLVAAGCKGKTDNAADTSGTAAMGDTTGMGTGSMAPTGTTMVDSTGMTTGAYTDTSSTMGDTIKRQP